MPAGIESRAGSLTRPFWIPHQEVDEIFVGRIAQGGSETPPYVSNLVANFGVVIPISLTQR
jgi:hypothetical protein